MLQKKQKPYYCTEQYCVNALATWTESARRYQQKSAEIIVGETEVVIRETEAFIEAEGLNVKMRE